MKFGRVFFGWQVVWAAFAVAVFGWGASFYGPPIFLHAIHEARGWPISLISAAVTCHFLLGAVVVGNLAALHHRFGLAAVTQLGALATALGFLGWALAFEPWQLFVATLFSGFGWAAMGAAAINAMVSPWFIRRRPAALSMAYNGASVGGVVMSPLWVLLLALLGFVSAAVVVGILMVLAVWWLSRRYLAHSPSGLGLLPDGDAATGPPLAQVERRPASLDGHALWRSPLFVTLVVATSLGLFAQIGLIAHLFSLLVPALGAQLAGLAVGMATACAIAGRSGLAWLLPPEADRRRAAAVNFALQVCGSLVLLAAGGVSVSLLLLGVALFGLGLGNAASLPALIAQQDFASADTARVVALVTACSQAAYAFAPAVFGLLRDLAPAWPVKPGDVAPMLFIAAALIQLMAAGTILLARRRAD